LYQAPELVRECGSVEAARGLLRDIVSAHDKAQVYSIESAFSVTVQRAQELSAVVAESTPRTA
jgi:hypothetical protein